MSHSEVDLRPVHSCVTTLYCGFFDTIDGESAAEPPTDPRENGFRPVKTHVCSGHAVVCTGYPHRLRVSPPLARGGTAADGSGELFRNRGITGSDR